MNERTIFIVCAALILLPLCCVLCLRRYRAFALASDRLLLTGAILEIPAYTIMLIWPNIPDWIKIILMVPGGIYIMRASCLLLEKEGMRNKLLRKHLSYWRWVTGTPPPGFDIAGVAHVEPTVKYFRLKRFFLAVSAALLLLICVVTVFGIAHILNVILVIGLILAVRELSFSK